MKYFKKIKIMSFSNWHCDIYNAYMALKNDPWDSKVKSSFWTNYFIDSDIPFSKCNWLKELKSENSAECINQWESDMETSIWTFTSVQFIYCATELGGLHNKVKITQLFTDCGIGLYTLWRTKIFTCCGSEIVHRKRVIVFRTLKIRLGVREGVGLGVLKPVWS